MLVCARVKEKHQMDSLCLTLDALLPVTKSATGSLSALITQQFFIFQRSSWHVSNTHFLYRSWSGMYHMFYEKSAGRMGDKTAHNGITVCRTPSSVLVPIICILLFILDSNPNALSLIIRSVQQSPGFGPPWGRSASWSLLQNCRKSQNMLPLSVNDKSLYFFLLKDGCLTHHSDALQAGKETLLWTLKGRFAVTNTGHVVWRHDREHSTLAFVRNRENSFHSHNFFHPIQR